MTIVFLKKKKHFLQSVKEESFRWMSSFKWKSSSIFQMDGQKGQAQWIHIHWIVLGRYCGAAKSHAHIRVRGRKLRQTKHLINLTLSKACWQNRKNIMASKAQLAPVPKLYIAGKWDKHSCKTSCVSQMLTTRCQHSLNADNVLSTFLMS